MAWVTPPTVTAGVTGIAGSHINDLSADVAYLAASRPFDLAVTQDSGSDYSLTSTSWADADATNLKVIVVTQVTNAKVHLVARFTASTSSGHIAYFDWHDGTTYSHSDESGTAMGSNGVASLDNNVRQQITVESWFVAQSAGTHTYTLRYKTGGAGTLTIFKTSHPIVKWGKEEG